MILLDTLLQISPFAQTTNFDREVFLKQFWMINIKDIILVIMAVLTFFITYNSLQTSKKALELARIVSFAKPFNEEQFTAVKTLSEAMKAGMMTLTTNFNPYDAAATENFSLTRFIGRNAFEFNKYLLTTKPFYFELNALEELDIMKVKARYEAVLPNEIMEVFAKFQIKEIHNYKTPAQLSSIQDYILLTSSMDKREKIIGDYDEWFLTANRYFQTKSIKTFLVFYIHIIELYRVVEKWMEEHGRPDVFIRQRKHN